MLKATIKHAFSVLLTLTLIGLPGCSSPEERKAERIDAAIELWDDGDAEAALARLEELSEAYPNDATILQQIGTIYQEEGEAAMAAFYLEQAYRQSPDDLERLYQAYAAQRAAGQSGTAAELLETLAETSPDAMTPELWLQLGTYRAEQALPERALEAYLKGVRPDTESPEPETAVAIGDLFKQVGNLSQAERWYQIAAESEDPNAMPALFGLLEIHLRNKRWADAEAIVEQLDARFPGALDASEWSEARADLERWRDAQATMRAELAKSRPTEPDTEAREAAAEAQETTAENESADAPNTSTADAGESGSSAASDPDASGKSGVVADLEAFEAMADAPALEDVSDPGTEVPAEDPERSESAVAFDPSIAVEPADPDWGIGVRFDQQDTGAQVTFGVDNAAPALPDFGQGLPSSPASPSAEAPTRPRTVEELLADAGRAEAERNFDQAISTYWRALGLANDRADVWNLLSRAYLVAGEARNAETAALEAIRLAPGEVGYTLDYLRVAQRSKSADDFVAELENAYDRFPRSPEITLSLARAYDRISGNRNASATLYRRFLDLAPSHPLRSEAESALRRLR